jgi:phage repressor protein C with HTH and peptisase S24 domain
MIFYNRMRYFFMLKFSERLRAVIKSLGIEDKVFASAGNVEKATLSGYLNLGRLPNQKTLAAWVKAYDIDAHWLLTGEGDMFQKDKSYTIRRIGQNAAGETACVLEPDSEEPVGRVVPVYAMAAAGQALEAWESDAICQICIPVTYYRESILIVQIKGHSMEPEIHDGAFVGLNTEERGIVAGERYGVRIPYEGLTVKRIFVDPQAGELILKSINPEHPPMRVVLDGRDDLIVGRAVWVMQML